MALGPRIFMRTLRPLKVGLNLLHLVPGETGGSEIYARRLIPAILGAASDVDLVGFVSREGGPSLRAESWAEDLDLRELQVKGASRTRRVLAEQTLLPLAARRERIDLLHNVFSTAPALPSVPQVTTVHDLIYKRFPEAHTGLRSMGMRGLIPLAARRSRRVIAISEATKRDIVQYLGVDAARIDVVHEGPGFTPVNPEEEEAIRRRHSLGTAPIVLSVSAHRPHKNLERLIDAMIRLQDPAVLVVPGYATSWDRELRRHAAGAPGRVRFLGWVSDAELEGLYRSATCLAFPSLAEGFGLPVLEAMIRGLPVACSDSTSLPEIAGEAAIYFDPTDVGGIADAIVRLLRDEELREHLASAGLARAARFTWSEAAQGTIAAYRLALAS